MGALTETGKAVFLSYASQDAEAAKHIGDALRAAGVEVWFDQSEQVHSRRGCRRALRGDGAHRVLDRGVRLARKCGALYQSLVDVTKGLSNGLSLGIYLSPGVCCELNRKDFRNDLGPRRGHRVETAVGREHALAVQH